MKNKPYNANASSKPAPMLADNMAEAIISTDKDLHIKSWNKAAEALYGLGRKEVMGKFLPAVVCFGFVNDSFAGFIGRLARTLHWKGELLYIRKDGILKCIPSYINAVCDASSDVLGYVMVCHDEHQPGALNTGLRGIFDAQFQYVGLVNDQAAFPWNIVLHWHEHK